MAKYMQVEVLAQVLVFNPAPEWNYRPAIHPEAIHLGQTVRDFRIELMHFNKKVGEIEGITIGRKRILTFPSKLITSFHVYLTIKKAMIM